MGPFISSNLWVLTVVNNNHVVIELFDLSSLTLIEIVLLVILQMILMATLCKPEASQS